MILEHVELHQICQHEHLEYDLKPGLIGILGPNGAGKSNFVNMTFATLTGDFSVNPGVKDDNVRWGKPPDDYSAVTARWQHGETFTVRRALAGCTNYLRREGKKELRGAKEITAEIESIIGIPRKALDFMFVPQWQMFSFISADPATRSTTFSHLCGTAQVEKIHKQLGEEIKVYRSAADSVRDNRQDIEQRLLERTARLVELDKSIAAARKRVLPLADVEQYEEDIKEAQLQAVLLQRMKKAVAQKAESVKAQHSAKLRVAGLEKELQLAEARRQLLQEEVESASKELDTLIQRDKQNSRKEVLKSIISEKPLPPPPAPDWYDDREDLEQSLYTIKQKLDSDSKLVALFESGSVAECPTCHTPTKNLVDTVRILKAALPTLEKEYLRLKDQIQSCKNHDTAIHVYNKATAKQQAHKAAAKAELDAMPELPQTSGKSVAELEEVCFEYDELVASITGLNKQLQIRKTELAVVDRDVVCTRDTIAEIEDQLNDEFEDYDEAPVKAVLEAHYQATNNIAVFEARKQDLEELNKADREELEKVTKVLDSTAVARQYIADLEETRDVAHRDNFPKLAAQKWLDDLTGLVNETLADFDSPFRVETTEDLSFIAIKPDGRRERAERLSGGQKMLLALAFRFSVNRLMAADIGMMILDEPTAGVDKTNVENMTDILKRLSSYTKDQGRQIMIITHDENLTRAFDQVIYIDKQN